MSDGEGDTKPAEESSVIIMESTYPGTVYLSLENSGSDGGEGTDSGPSEGDTDSNALVLGVVPEKEESSGPMAKPQSSSSPPSSPKDVTVSVDVEDEDYDVDVVDDTKQVGVLSTFFLLLKSFICTGPLFVPSAYRAGGLVFTTCVYIVIASMAYYCMILLIRCRRRTGVCSFQGIAHQAYGKPASFLVQLSLCATQLAFVTAYYVFIAQNVKDVAQSLSDCAQWVQDIPIFFIISIQVLIYVPLVWIRKMKILSYPSLLADIFVVFSVAYIIGADGVDVYQEGVNESVIYGINKSEFLLAFGLAVYCYEGIGLVIPIESSMREKKKLPPTLGITIIIVTALFCSFGIMNYLVYAEEIEPIILLNLDRSVFMTQVVQIFYMLAIIFSYPLMFYPAIEIIEFHLLARMEKNTSARLWTENFLRTCIVVALSFLAMVGAQNFDKFVAIIGSLCCVPLAFVYPAAFHFKLCAKNLASKVIDVCFFSIGIAILLATTSTALYEWITKPATGFPLSSLS